MSRIPKRKLLSLAAFLAVGVAFGTLHFSQAQVGGGLDLSVPPLQLINGSAAVVYQHKYVSGAYGIAWRSTDLLWGSFYMNNFSLGDVDNDSDRELAAVLNYKTREQRIKGKKVNYYDQKIVVFEDGCPHGGLPSWESQPLGESTSATDENTMIADVDNDGNNEIVLVKGYHIEVYDLTAGELTLVMKGNDYPYPIFSIDAGDADNDGEDEIVLSIFRTGAPIIWKYENATWSSKTAEPIPPEYYQAGFDWLNLDYARVRDADNIVDEFGNKDNEIVGGGNNDRLMIWKYNKTNESYDLQFVSKDLGGFTQGVDAGDIDGDGQNEVVIGSCSTVQGKKKTPGSLCIFTFNGAGYVMADSFPLDCDLGNLGLGDLDGDGRADIALSCIPAPSLRIYDFIGSVGSGSIQLAYGGDGSGLEIR
jgi:hypothetical protein